MDTNHILVTGGTGYLGKLVVQNLKDRNIPVSVLSSRGESTGERNARFMYGDLSTGEGLKDALENVDVIIHCASRPLDFKKVDIDGTRHLMKAVNKDVFRHFIYISIVGIDKSSYPYYQAKLEVEKLIRESGLSYTILRTTQFHEFVRNMIQSFLHEQESGMEVLEIPAGLRFQTVDAAEVAGQLVQAAEGSPQGLLPDFGGPEVLTLEQMAGEYLHVFDHVVSIRPVMTSVPIHALFRTGINLCPENAYGQKTWKEFLKQSTD